MTECVYPRARMARATQYVSGLDGSRLDGLRGRDREDEAEDAREFRCALLERLRSLLIRLTGGEGMFDLLQRLQDGSVSCQDLAEQIGVTRQTVWRRLLRFQKSLEQPAELLPGLWDGKVSPREVAKVLGVSPVAILRGIVLARKFLNRRGG